MNQVAWFLATAPHAACRDGERAVELARRAIELDTRDRPADLLDTLAAAHAEVGDFGEAVALQRDVVRHFGGAVPTGYTERLVAYENARPWRERGL